MLISGFFFCLNATAFAGGQEITEPPASTQTNDDAIESDNSGISLGGESKAEDAAAIFGQSTQSAQELAYAESSQQDTLISGPDPLGPCGGPKPGEKPDEPSPAPLPAPAPAPAPDSPNISEEVENDFVPSDSELAQIERQKAEVDNRAIISESVNELGDENYDIRVKAYKQLEGFGGQAAPQLEAAAQSEDPEVRSKANELLNSLKLNESYDSLQSRFEAGKEIGSYNNIKKAEAPPVSGACDPQPVIDDKTPPAEDKNPVIDGQTREEIDSLINKLGDDRYDVRREAFEELQGLGKQAVPQLKEALNSEDAEVKHSAERLLLPSDPPSVTSQRYEDEVAIKCLSAVPDYISKENIASLIDQLGSDTFKERNDAAAELEAAGPQAIEQLQEALVSTKDAETLVRIKEILPELEKQKMREEITAICNTFTGDQGNSRGANLRAQQLSYTLIHLSEENPGFYSDVPQIIEGLRDPKKITPELYNKIENLPYEIISKEWIDAKGETWKIADTLGSIGLEGLHEDFRNNVKKNPDTMVSLAKIDDNAVRDTLVGVLDNKVPLGEDNLAGILPVIDIRVQSAKDQTELEAATFIDNYIWDKVGKDKELLVWVAETTELPSFTRRKAISRMEPGQEAYAEKLERLTDDPDPGIQSEALNSLLSYLPRENNGGLPPAAQEELLTKVEAKLNNAEPGAADMGISLDKRSKDISQPERLDSERHPIISTLVLMTVDKNDNEKTKQLALSVLDKAADYISNAPPSALSNDDLNTANALIEFRSDYTRKPLWTHNGQIIDMKGALKSNPELSTKFNNFLDKVGKFEDKIKEESHGRVINKFGPNLIFFQKVIVKPLGGDNSVETPEVIN